MKPRIAIPLALVLALALLWAGAPAHAFVRSRTSGTPGTPLKWPGSCAFVQTDSAGTPDLAAAAVFDVVQKSMKTWNDLAQDCSYLQLNFDQPAPLEAHYDGVNVVKFRGDKWCHPDDAQSHNQCYDRSAAAITTVFFVDRPGDPHHGTILDADVELNNINFTFVIVEVGQSPVARDGTSPADLQNTLTHELGHLQGLDHTCKDSATPVNEIDENGNPPPPCGNIPTADRVKITTATMYNVAAPTEIVKRIPKQDDIAGICDAYTKSADPHSCAHTDLKSLSSNGCAMGAGASVPGVIILLMFVAGAFLVLRRRRRRAH